MDLLCRNSWAWITENMATGARINQASDIDRLRMGGVTHVLNSAREEDLDSLHALATGTYVTTDKFPFDYYHNPTADDGHPKPTSWFKASLDFSWPVIGPGGQGKLYVHCKAGYNRGPSTCYFLLRVLGWTAWQAQWRIRTRRLIVNLGGLRYVKDAERALADLGYSHNL